MLDFLFWEQMGKQGFKIELLEGEEIEIARKDKEKSRAYLKIKNEVYSFGIKFPFDFRKIKKESMPKKLNSKTTLFFIKTKLYKEKKCEKKMCQKCKLNNICKKTGCAFTEKFVEYTPLEKLKTRW